MRCICGETVGGDGGYLLGRVKLWRHGGISRLPEGCILCLSTERDLREISAYLGCSGRIVGIIILYPTRAYFPPSLPIPCFLPTVELCEGALDGRIALLDLGASRLLVDPSVDVLSEYAKREEKKGENYPARRGRLCSSRKLRSGGDIFEGALALLESDTQSPLCVSLDLPRTSAERLSDEAEGLFRAAVYGELSIMLSGFCTAEELTEANSLLHSVFCELEAEGREVNGCAARGVLIDSPIWLTQRHRLGRCDFICFDFDLLTSRLLGICGECELKRGQTDTLCRFWEDYRAAFGDRERAELRAISRSEILRELFFDWVDFMNISEIYLPCEKKT